MVGFGFSLVQAAMVSCQTSNARLQKVMKEAKEMFRKDQGICSQGRVVGNAGAGQSGKGSLGRFILGACSAVKWVLPMVLY